LAAPLAAQKEKPPKAQKPHPHAPHRPAKQARAHPLASQEVHFALSGVTADTSLKAQSALAALTYTDWVCPKCAAVKAAAGKCETCAVDLVEHAQRALQDAKVELADDGSAGVQLRLQPGAHVRLGEVEKALEGTSAHVDRAALLLTANARATFGGASSEDDAKKLQKALQEADLPGAQATYDEVRKEVLVDVRGARPTWAKLAEVGKGLDPALELADFTWTADPGRS